MRATARPVRSPVNTNAEPGVGSMLPSTARTGAVSGTVLGPVLESRSRNTPAVLSTSSQRSERISVLRHPVSANSRIAAIAPGFTEPSALRRRVAPGQGA